MYCKAFVFFIFHFSFFILHSSFFTSSELLQYLDALLRVGVGAEEGGEEVEGASGGEVLRMDDEELRHVVAVDILQTWVAADFP